MIPYFTIPNIHLGPLTIEPFGIFAAAGIYLAARILSGRSARMGWDPQILLDYSVWGVLGGIVGGHLLHLLAYHPEELNKSPFQILRIWDGLSSFGGLMGGIVAAAIFFRARGLRFHDFSDFFALGLAPGWGVARLGCFVVHDHIGVPTTFPLAVNFPRYGVRFDLGLIDAIALFTIAVILYAVSKAPAMKGRLLPLMAVLYGTQRFFTDFLRASDTGYVDKRYAGLTPAQYACMGIVLYGVALLVKPPVVHGPPASGNKPKPATA